MIQGQILGCLAPRAAVANPLPALFRREVGAALFALVAWLSCDLGIAWGEPPKATAIGSDTQSVAARLVYIPVDHAALAVAGLPADYAGDICAQLPLRSRAAHRAELQLMRPEAARFGAEAGLSSLDHRLGTIEATVTDFALQVHAPHLLRADNALRSGSIGAGAGTEPDHRSSPLRVSEEGRGSGEDFAAVLARRSDWHVLPSSQNLGEFGGTLGHADNVQFSAYAGNTEPSRARKISTGNPRGAEGVTTRSKGNGGPTSAQLRSNGEDIVWTASSVARDAEVGGKLAYGNKIDSGYEILNTAPSDVISAAEFDWKQASVAVTISGLEQAQNSGSEAILDLLESRIEVAEKTMQNNLSGDMYSDGTATSGKQIGGLQLLVADVPTSGTVGGINRATYTFWRNQAFQCTSDAQGGSAASATNIQKYMNIMYLRTMRQSDKVDLIVADTNYYQFYWQSLQAIQRITSTDMASAGFTSLQYMGADVVADGGIGGACPANHMYFLNGSETVAHATAH